jgi:C_GCAxxG_C_C family probable redox protein
MKSDEAEAVYRSGFNCAQSVLIPFAREGGLTEAEAARIASPFGAGMARMQETCGAVTGALMALGLERGFEKPGDQAGKDGILAEAKGFLARFKSELGTVLCKDFLGCDLNTEEGQAYHKATNQRELVCMNCVRRAAAIVESMRGEDV